MEGGGGRTRVLQIHDVRYHIETLHHRVPLLLLCCCCLEIENTNFPQFKAFESPICSCDCCTHPKKNRVPDNCSLPPESDLSREEKPIKLDMTALKWYQHAVEQYQV